MNKMNFEGIFEKAKAAQKELKAQYGSSVTETRFVVQFQNLQAYQYKTDSAGMGKLRKVNFDEVILVQIVVGSSVKGANGYNKFRMKAVRMLECKENYEAISKDADAGNEFSW